MMTRMPELSRRAVLRLGAGAAAGAFGAYTVDRLLPGRPPQATPVSMTGTGIPLAPPVPLEP
ncbi:MAG: alpha/beta hydrolase, partial [Mycobacterium sp.]